MPPGVTSLVATKPCSTCGLDRPRDEYPKRRGTRDGRGYQCNSCVYARVLVWRKNNADKHSATTARYRSTEKYKNKAKAYRKAKAREIKARIREWGLETFYKMSLADYERLFQAQNGACKICKRHQSEFEYRLCVDHCHSTGRVRGLLCKPCNLGIASFSDDPARLASAVTYLSPSLSNG